MANFRDYLQQTAPTQVDEFDARSMAYNLLKTQAGAGGPISAGSLPTGAQNHPGLPAGPVNLFKEENLTPFLQAVASTKQGLSQDNALNAAKFAINYWKGFNPNAEAEYGGTPQTPGNGGQTPTTPPSGNGGQTPTTPPSSSSGINFGAGHWVTDWAYWDPNKKKFLVNEWPGTNSALVERDTIGHISTDSRLGTTKWQPYTPSQYTGLESQYKSYLQGL